MSNEKYQEKLEKLDDEVATFPEVEPENDNDSLVGDHLELLAYDTDSEHNLSDHHDDLHYGQK